MTVDRFQLERFRDVQQGDVFTVRADRNMTAGQVDNLKRVWNTSWARRGIAPPMLLLLGPGLRLERVASVMRPMVEGDL